MQCKVVRERLSELLDGVLAVEEAAAVREHLAACEACRRERDELAETWDLLDAWDGLEPSEDFARSVMRRIATESARKVVPIRVAPRAVWWQRPTVVSRLVAAFAVAILSAVLFVPRAQVQPSTPVLDEVLASFDSESRVAVIDEVPTYVVAHHGESKHGKDLQRLLAPTVDSPTDDLLEDLLTEPKGNG